MTFLQHSKEKAILTKLIIIGVFPLVLGVIWLIIVYNQRVNLNHEISAVNIEIKNTQAETAELQKKYFSFLDAVSLAKIKSERNLQETKKPNYFSEKNQWAFVSN
ncbi:MAG: hypothetical protein WCX12_01030 [Candidatus Paceibacterota bacterium]|jgi:hypothetical protein